MVMYPSNLVDVEQIENDSTRSIDCKRSDDIVISHALERLNIPRFTIMQNEPSIGQLSFGFLEDALHKQQNHSNAYHQCLLITDHYE